MTRATCLTMSILTPTLALLVAAEPAPANAQPVEVTVKKVMLFSSGVAYIEHGGTVQGDATATLRFTATQLNDLLKSLQIQDLDGGTVGTVVYPSAEPVERTLKSFQIDLSGQPTVSQLLGQLRGAPVTVSAKGETTSGTVLGVEVRQIPAGERGVISRPVLSIVGVTGIRQVELEDVTSLSIDDPKLKDELTKALTALAQARNQDKRPIDIRFNGTGPRRVRLGYVVEAPVWKVSYRLVLPAKVGTDGALQGWALVDNQTESDWTNVDLTLVSGRPVSFVQNLYQPLYLSRPEVAMETFAGLRPKTYESADHGYIKAMAMPAAAPAPMMERSLRQAQKSDNRGGIAMGMASAAFDATSSVVTAATGEKLGEQFVYTVPAVSLPRQRAAMIPIVNGPLTVERVSIYNQNQLPKNPMLGAIITNSTSNHLVAGPVTVLDGGYAGDAQLGSLAPKQTRMLSYAIDLPVKISTDDKGGRRIAATAVITKGVLFQTMKYVEAKVYKASSDADADRILIIEHPRRDGYELVDTPAPSERTDELLRFRLAVPAGKAAEIAVKEQYAVDNRIELTQLDQEALLTYSTNGDIPATIREAFAKAAQLRASVAEAQAVLTAIQADLDTAAKEQDRVRNNIRTVGQQGDTGARQLKKLNELETRIESQQGKLEQGRADLSAKQKALSDWLATLDVK